jgi:hypothetical protein
LFCLSSVKKIYFVQKLGVELSHLVCLPPEQRSEGVEIFLLVCLPPVIPREGVEIFLLVCTMSVENPINDRLIRNSSNDLKQFQQTTDRPTGIFRRLNSDGWWQTDEMESFDAQHLNYRIPRDLSNTICQKILFIVA